MNEYKRTLSQLKEVRDNMSSVGDNNVNPFTVQAAIDIFEDIVTNGKNSRYYREVNPIIVEVSATSQCRAVVLDVRHLDALKSDVKARGGFTTAILTAETTNRQDCTLLNGGHRHQVGKDLLMSGFFNNDFKMPSYHIPKVEMDKIAPIIDMLQAYLNEHEVAKRNTDKDFSSTLTSMVPGDIDLTDEREYKNQISRFEKIFPGRSSKVIKIALTKLANKRLSAASKLTTLSTTDASNMFKEQFSKVVDLVKPDSSSNFKACFSSGFKNIDPSRNKHFYFRPINGNWSNFDKAIYKDNFKRAEPDIQDVIHLFHDNDNKGDLTSLFKIRQSVFKKYLKVLDLEVRKVEKIIGSKLTVKQKMRVAEQNLPKYVFIAPQIKQDTIFDGPMFGGGDFCVKGEITGLSDSWGLVTREQIFELFCNKTSSIEIPQEWVCTQGSVNKNQNLSLVS